MIYDKFVAGNNKTYVGLNINSPMLHALKQKAVRSLSAFFRCKISLNRS